MRRDHGPRHGRRRRRVSGSDRRRIDRGPAPPDFHRHDLTDGRARRFLGAGRRPSAKAGLVAERRVRWAERDAQARPHAPDGRRGFHQDLHDRRDHLADRQLGRAAIRRRRDPHRGRRSRGETQARCRARRGPRRHPQRSVRRHLFDRARLVHGRAVRRPDDRARHLVGADDRAGAAVRRAAEERSGLEQPATRQGGRQGRSHLPGDAAADPALERGGQARHQGRHGNRPVASPAGRRESRRDGIHGEVAGDVGNGGHRLRN